MTATNELIKNMAMLMAAIAWPAVICTLFLIFRAEIKLLLERINNLKLPGGSELSWGNASIDHDKPSELDDRLQGPVPPIASFRTGSVANLYWLGHDLMWTTDALLRGAPRNSILHGLRQTLHHAQALEFEDANVVDLLSRVNNEAISTLSGDWHETRRDEIAGILGSIRDQIGRTIEKSQVDFEPWAKQTLSI